MQPDGHGSQLNPQDALKGLRHVRFILLTLLWGFIFGPLLAYLITLILLLDYPYAIGLLLIGMAPSTSMLPIMVNKAKGDLEYTAAFMLLASVGTVIFMPFAVASRLMFFYSLLPLAIGLASACSMNRKSSISIGMATCNLGVASRLFLPSPREIDALL